ncbi:unnamed protein product, partial [Meganyctiphanes norvegica]
SCPDLFEQIGECCYYFSHDHTSSGVTWYDARTYCQELGTLLDKPIDLAEVGTTNNKCDDLKLMEIIGTSKAQHTYFGGSDEGHEGTFQWKYSGQKLSIKNSLWYHDRPLHGSHADTSDCLLAAIWGDYARAYFTDWSCNSHYQFVCQIF